MKIQWILPESKMVRFAGVLICCLCIASCKEHRTTTGLGGVNVTFYGGAQHVRVAGDTAHVEVGSDKYDVSVQNGTLAVNGRQYGPVARGDDVTISGTQVKINGTAATPLAAER